ncbi:MAG: WbuC family cupin fold metalloprotein [Proteobacteria bacterium]|nr:WbuC family cupin fold metalloprotein [Pseudomonadota bacterium]
MKLLPHSLLDELAAKAALSPRARAHHNVHAGPEDPVQRFVVYALGGSYFRPHCHRERDELALVVRGHFDVLTFDDEGRVRERFRVGEGTADFAYETPRNTWHTLLPAPGGGAFFEVKQGPYDPATSTAFAAWAPAEGDDAVADYLTWLRSAQPGERL